MFTTLLKLMQAIGWSMLTINKTKCFQIFTAFNYNDRRRAHGIISGHACNAAAGYDSLCEQRADG